MASPESRAAVWATLLYRAGHTLPTGTLSTPVDPSGIEGSAIIYVAESRAVFNALCAQARSDPDLTDGSRTDIDDACSRLATPTAESVGEVAPWDEALKRAGSVQELDSLDRSARRQVLRQALEGVAEPRLMANGLVNKQSRTFVLCTFVIDVHNEKFSACSDLQQDLRSEGSRAEAFDRAVGRLTE